MSASEAASDREYKAINEVVNECGIEPVLTHGKGLPRDNQGALVGKNK